MDEVGDEERAAQLPPVGAETTRGRARLEPLAEVVQSERHLVPPPVVRRGLIPVMGMEEQGRALLEGATLVHDKKDRDRAHKLVNHQCRWLDDATYRMTASGMGKHSTAMSRGVSTLGRPWRLGIWLPQKVIRMPDRPVSQLGAREPASSRMWKTARAG